jgi:LCP family protein required for cell wall assembly
LKSNIEPNETQEARIPVRQRAAKRRRRPVWGNILWVLWIGLFLFGGTVAGWLGRSKVLTEVIPGLTADPKATFGKSAVNLLLLGCDEDLAPGGQQVLKSAGRADMILLARLDFEKNTITGVSIPRDTRVRLKGGTDHKINAYHNLAKPGKANELQQKAVEVLTGVKIDRTIQIDYTAFQELIDTVGGVEVMIKHRMDYVDKAGGLFVDFRPGRKLLDGYDAMCYVRYRKTTPRSSLYPKGGEGDPKAEGDFVRTERQRQLLLAFQGSVLKHITALPEIVEKGVAVLGGALTTREIAALATFQKKVGQKNVKMLRMPTKPGRGTFEEMARPGATKMFKDNGFVPSKSAEPTEDVNQ